MTFQRNILAQFIIDKNEQNFVYISKLERLMLTISPANETFRSLGVLFIGIHKTVPDKIEKIGICFEEDFQKSRMSKVIDESQTIQ